MKNYEEKRDQLIRETFDQCLSGIDGLPSARPEIIRKLKEQPKKWEPVRFRIPAIAAALVLVLCIGILAGTGRLGLPGTDEIRGGSEYTVQPISVPLSQGGQVTAPEGGVAGDTVLYYEPNMGTRYHLDPNCRSVAAKYQPLQGQFTWVSVNEEPFSSLEPCDVCGAPARESASVWSRNEIYPENPTPGEVMNFLQAGITDELKPLSLSVEQQGIRVDLTAGLVQGENAWFTYDIYDPEGKWAPDKITRDFNPSFFLYDGYGWKAIGLCKVDEDEAAHKSTYFVSTASGGEIDPPDGYILAGIGTTVGSSLPTGDNTGRWSFKIPVSMIRTDDTVLTGEQDDESMISASMMLEKNTFAGEESIRVNISLCNESTDDSAAPVTVTLYDPDGNKIDERVLDSCEISSWSGSWPITDARLDEGKLAFGLEYSACDGPAGADGKSVLQSHRFSFSRKIYREQEAAGAAPAAEETASVAALVPVTSGYSDNPLSMDFMVQKSSASRPGPATVSLSVTNTADYALPGAITVYAPDGTPAELPGGTDLQPGTTVYWEGTWEITQELLDRQDRGELAFRLQYHNYEPFCDPATGERQITAHEMTGFIDLFWDSSVAVTESPDSDGGDKPVKVQMALKKDTFSRPERIQVYISATNTADYTLPGPVTLYDPDGREIRFSLDPLAALEAGESADWSVTWDLTEQQLKEGRISFSLKYSSYGRGTDSVTGGRKEIVHKMFFSKGIYWEQDEPAETVSADKPPLSGEAAKNLKLWADEDYDDLKPLSLSCENQGVRMDIPYGLVKDGKAWFVYTMTEPYGTFFQRGADGGNGSSGSLRLGEYMSPAPYTSYVTGCLDSNEAAHTYTGYVCFSLNQPFGPEGKTLTVGCENPQIVKTGELDLLPLLKENGKVTGGVKFPGVMSEEFCYENGEGAPKLSAGTKVLDYKQPRLDLPVTRDVTLTGIGWIGSELHVQVHYTGAEPFVPGENDCMPWDAWCDLEIPGEDRYFTFLSWDDNGDSTVDWIEFAWNVSRKDAERITQLGLSVDNVTDMLSGRWEVSLPLDAVLSGDPVAEAEIKAVTAAEAEENLLRSCGPDFYRELVAANPDLPAGLRPVNLTCESGGIRLEILAASMGKGGFTAETDGYLDIIYTLQDLKGDRIRQGTTLGFSHELNVKDSILKMSYIPVSVYSEAEHKVTCLMSAWFEKLPQPEDGQYTFTLERLLNTEETVTDLAPFLAQYGQAVEGVTPPADMDIEYPPADTDLPEPMKILDYNNSLDIPVGDDGYRLSGIGWIDGLLHVQVDGTKASSPKRAQASEAWTVIRSELPGRGTVGTDSYIPGIRELTEHIAAVSPEEAGQLKLTLTDFVFLDRIPGEWTIRVPADMITAD